MKHFIPNCTEEQSSLILNYDPPLRRFEHDFVPLARLTLSDPARRKLRAWSWVSLRHKIARRPTGPVSFGHFSLRVQRKVTRISGSVAPGAQRSAMGRVQGGAPARGRRGWSPLALKHKIHSNPSKNQNSIQIIRGIAIA
jgi:hypothetical protein